MRNLKRALSLALASVMVLGMMVVGAGATSFDDFSDKDKVVNKEAVSTLVELNVINGKEDGAFDPTGIITRAEMAKLICTVLNGGKDPNLGSNVVTTYTDTAANWAAGYIEYCTTKGIVAGDGTGKFNPTNTVTGSEAAKMLLVAAGYQSAIEGYTGAAWANSVNVQANKVGLYDGLTIDPSLGLTRDAAAQMVYNALGINVVTYKYTMVTNGDGGFSSIPELVETNSAGVKKTVLEDKFGVVTVEGVVVANEFATLNAESVMDAGETRIDVTNHGDGQNTYTNTPQTFKVSSGAEELGRTVNLFVKPATSSANSSTKGLVIGGIIVTSDNKVVVDSSRDPIKDVVKDNKLSVNTTEDTATPKTQIAVNYGTYTELTDALRDAKDKTTGGVRGQVRTFIDNNDDGVVEYILTESYVLGKVTKYSTKDDGSITINGASSLAFDDKEDVVGFDDVNKGDYVLYAVIGGKLHVEKAESIEGELTAYDSGKSLTIDGEKINTSDLAFYADGSTLKNANSYNNLDKTATFYKDKQGNIIAVDGTAASNSYAFLVKAAAVGGTSDDTEVKVILDDGTTGTYILDTDNSSGVTVASKNLLCTYTASDDSIELHSVAAVDNDNTAVEIKKGNATVTGIAGAFADASTVYFYLDPKKVSGVTYDPSAHDLDDDLSVDSSKVYVGKDNAPSLSNSARDFLYVLDGTKIKSVVIVTDGIGGASDYMFLYQRTGKNSDGYTYNAIIDGELVKNVVITTDAGVGLYSYTTTTKGFYKVSSLTGALYEGNIQHIDGDSIIINNTEYNLTSNTVIANIDGGDTELEAVLNEGDYVSMKYDTDKKLEAIYVRLAYDNEQVEVTRNGVALSTVPAINSLNVGEDTISIVLNNATNVTGTQLKSLISWPSATAPDTIVVAFKDASGNALVDASNLMDDATMTVTFTTSGKTMVNTYDIDLTVLPA